MFRLKLNLICGGALLLLASCAGKTAAPQLTDSGLDPAKFVTEVDGKPTGLYVLKIAAGMEVCLTNFGGRIVSVNVPDRDGNFHDVVLGLDSIQAYLPENNLTDFGAAIGRYANRIGNGRLPINGDTIQLPVNNFGHTLHGGPTGWQYKVYDVKEATDSTLVLTLVSPDGDNSFPGEVKAQVTYRLTPDNALAIAYEATTDKPTVINMTNHSYFNLNGDPTKPITDNLIMINADSYTPVDSTFMTTGEILPVSGTPMDFTAFTEVGKDINNYDFEQIKNGKGFDHNWVLNTAGNLQEAAVSVLAPSTGITLTVYTDEPGVQFYSGNFLDGTVTGKNGIVYNRNAALCLETQHYPDSPNKSEWPSVVLMPGDTYKSQCIYKFGTEK